MDRAATLSIAVGHLASPCQQCYRSSHSLSTHRALNTSWPSVAILSAQRLSTGIELGIAIIDAAFLSLSECLGVQGAVRTFPSDASIPAGTATNGAAPSAHDALPVCFPRLCDVKKQRSHDQQRQRYSEETRVLFEVLKMKHNCI